jgi:putative phosphoribosyl transferase
MADSRTDSAGLRRDALVGGHRLEGTLTLSQHAKGLIIFAHGSGSSRRSPRNLQVARALNGRGLATLLFDLLTEEEAENRLNVFDIGLLGGRVADAVRWAGHEQATRTLPIGLFGASTGAAASLVAAAEQPQSVAAVVSRGGRPDLASHYLARVRAPTLLIVGGEDYGVIELNEEAYRELRCEKRFEIVPHATHLFEERGAMEQVVELAGDWFEQWFAPERKAGQSP